MFITVILHAERLSSIFDNCSLRVNNNSVNFCITSCHWSVHIFFLIINFLMTIIILNHISAFWITPHGGWGYGRYRWCSLHSSLCANDFIVSRHDKYKGSCLRSMMIVAKVTDCAQLRRCLSWWWAMCDAYGCNMACTAELRHVPLCGFCVLYAL